MTKNNIFLELKSLELIQTEFLEHVTKGFSMRFQLSSFPLPKN